jgi:hypothetical protein
MEEKETLPNAVATLVLGICSIVFGCLFIGLVLGIVGLAISGSSVKLNAQDPNKYNGYQMLNAGRIMSIIGIILGAIYVLYYIVVVVIIGTAGFSLWNMQHQ